MTQRGILGLGFATLVVMIVALLYTGGGDEAPPADGELLLPGLREHINGIDAIDILSAGSVVDARLRRDGDRWRVDNLHGYEADFRRVHDLLRALAVAVKAEPRTAMAEWYPRLGLSDIELEDARGRLVAFPGRDLPAVIVGDADDTTGGRYVRVVGEAQSWLSDQPLDLPDLTVDWAERAVMDIPASELAEVTILHADGDRIRLRPADEEGDQWVLLDVPEGMQAAPRWDIRPVANGLANVRLENVRPHDEAPSDAVRALYVTRDGLNFVVNLFSDDDGNWAHFSVSAEPAAVREAEDSDDNESQGDDQRLLADAAAVDARLSPWQFSLSQRKFETMTRRQAALLVPVESDE